MESSKYFDSETGSDGNTGSLPSDQGPVESIFDEPDFFETILMGSPQAADDDRDDAVPSGNHTESLERGRLLRQATEISKRFRSQQKELDRREANLQAAVAAQQVEQRAWRLSAAEADGQIAAVRKQLDSEAQSLQEQANEVAAWESAATEELREKEKDLEVKCTEIEKRRKMLESQLRLLQHQRSELDQQKRDYAESVTSHDRQQQLEVEELSKGQKLLQDGLKDLRVKQAAIEQCQTKMESFFQQQTRHLPKDPSESAELPEMASECKPHKPSISIAEISGRVLQHGADFECELGQMQVALKSLMDDMVLPMQKRLSQSTSSVTAPSIEMSRLGQHLRTLLQHSEKVLHHFQGENQTLLTQLKVRLKQLAVEEREIVQAVRNQLEEIHNHWLRIDAAHAPEAPHFLRRPEVNETRDELIQ